MAVLSIQSHVAYGHVGNAAAVFPLQRLGLEVWPVHTAMFSNHLGYPGFKGRALEADLVRDVVHGIAERGVLARCRAVLTGYLAEPALGAVALEAVAAARTANPTALYACDPVIGDDGESYVRPGVAEFLRERAVPAADLLLPNRYELGVLAGGDPVGEGAILAAARALVARGPRLVVVTSADAGPDAIDVYAVTPAAAWRVRVPRLAVDVHGTGDAFAAIFLGRYLEKPEPPRALALAAGALHGILRATPAAGGTEMALVAAQDEIAAPSRSFVASKVG